MGLSSSDSDVRASRSLNAFIDAYLRELLHISNCDNATCLYRFLDSEGFHHVSREAVLALIDFKSLTNLLFRAQKSQTEYFAITKVEMRDGPRFGKLAEHFDSGEIETAACIPLRVYDQLIGVACLFGSPAAAGSKPDSRTKSQILSLTNVTAVGL